MGPTSSSDELRDLQQKVTEKADDAQALAGLARHPGWETLRKIFEGRKQAYFATLANSLMQNGRHINYERLAYNRGFFDALDWILANPTRAEKQLERQLARLEELEEIAKE